MQGLPSHTMNTTTKPSSNLGESGIILYPLEVNPATHGPIFPSPHTETRQAQRRIPEGTVHGIIPLEAAKAFPTRLFQNPDDIRFAYADASNGENIELHVKVAPAGAKTAPHPQLIIFVRGDYHVEPWFNYGGGSDPLKWTTWMEFHMDAAQILLLIKALLDAKLALEVNHV